MGCKCDPGYNGPSCSERNCPVGVDPFYYADNPTSVHVTTVTYAIYDSFCQDALDVCIISY